jgi:hypothetical protein
MSQTQTYGNVKKNIEWGVRMLRHIISVSLAITTCATFIATKANAATLTVTPSGSLQKNRGESITFIFSLNPAPFIGNTFTFQSLSYDWDKNELSFAPDRSTEVPRNFKLNGTTTIARVTFDVIQPIKDGSSDLFNAYASYQESDFDLITKTPNAVGKFDVEPVPEPLTILGAATALGYGAILKRQSFKNKKS